MNRQISWQTILRVAIYSICGMSAGCGDLLKQPYPAKSYFALEPGTPDEKLAAALPATNPATNRVLLVRDVRIIPPYDGLAFVYQTGPEQFDTDYYVNWIATPSAMLSGNLTNWLAGSVSASVVGSGTTARPDYLLETEVTKLAIDRRDVEHPRAVVAARLFLSRETSGATTIIWQKFYSAEYPAQTSTPSGYAAAFDQALRQLCTQLTHDLQTMLPSGLPQELAPSLPPGN